MATKKSKIYTAVGKVKKPAAPKAKEVAKESAPTVAELQKELALAIEKIANGRMKLRTVVKYALMWIEK